MHHLWRRVCFRTGTRKAPFKKTNGCCNSAMAPTIQEVREQIALPIHPWKLKKNENEQVCFNSPFVIIYRGFEFHLAVEDRRHMRFHEKCNCSVGWQLHSRKPRKHGFSAIRIWPVLNAGVCLKFSRISAMANWQKLHLKNIRFTLTSIYDL